MTTLSDAWRHNGMVDLDGFGDESMWEALRDEAHACAPSAFERRFDKVELYRDGSMMSPQRCRAHRGGDAVRALAHNHELLELARSTTGMDSLVPARYGYKYYERGSFMGVHRDAARCSITFTFALTDNLAEMSWLPGLREESNESVRTFIEAHGHLPEEAERLPISFCSMKGFDGYNIPHWRMPFEDDFGILGTVCYFDL